VVICLDNSTGIAKPIFEKKNTGGIEIIDKELYQQIQG
jgi:hypothetical protein